MQLIETIDDFRAALGAERSAGRTVGLVPTMGFLHEGHASLMRRAANECDIAAATIFVNPLQFAPTEDLAAYPSDVGGDLRLAESCGVSLVFAPSLEEMYPGGRGSVLTQVHVGGVSEAMEGASRPTHFDGVATVVAKLLAIAGPCRAYFGEKDFQQLAVVRAMVDDLSFPVEVVGCPTVRDEDGLALSSRNAYLTTDERAAAPALYRAIRLAADAVENGMTDLDLMSKVMSAVVAAEPLLSLDYATAVPQPGGEIRLLIAARIGRARLIDNLGVRAATNVPPMSQSPKEHT